MSPSSEECKAKKVYSMLETTESKMNPVFGVINTWTQHLQSWLGDVYNTIPHIAISGCLIPFVLGIAWLVFLRFAAKTFVFLVLYGLLFFLTFLSLQFLIYGEVITADILFSLLDKINNATGLSIDSEGLSNTLVSVDLFESEAQDRTMMYETLGWTLSVITVIYLLILLSLYRRIKIAVAVIKEATIAVGAMPLILLFPIFTVGATVGAGVYWAFTCLYLVSMSEFEAVNLTDISEIIRQNNSETETLIELLESVTDENRTWERSHRYLLQQDPSILPETLSNLTRTAMGALVDLPYVEIFFVYHLLGYYWINQLIQAIGATTIAGAVGSWYWSTSEEGKKNKNMPRRPVLKSLYRAFRYHIGSLIFGSLIIALVQLIRTILMYIDNNTKGLQRKNRVIRILMKGIQCCLCVLEYVLKFITKNAYIFIALFGKSFCSATKDVFKLLVSNFLRIGTATAISNIIILLGRILIVSVSCFVCTTILSFPSDSELGQLVASLSLADDPEPPSTIVPSVIVSGLLSWFVSGCFMSVYGLAIDTILISMCVDEEKNDGSQEKPYYMTPSLKKLTRKWNKKKVHTVDGGKLEADKQK